MVGHRPQGRAGNLQRGCRDGGSEADVPRCVQAQALPDPRIENLIHIDCQRESPNVSAHDDRAAMFCPYRLGGRLALLCCHRHPDLRAQCLLMTQSGHFTCVSL
jgi:hypothetical protein